MKVATTDVVDYIDEEAPNYGVDPELARKIMMAENMGPMGKMPDMLDTDTTSRRGAEGIMQVMPATRKSLEEQGHLRYNADALPWQQQVHHGLAALKEIQERTKSDDVRVIASDYNAGPRGGRLAATGDFDRLPAETSNYLKKVEMAGNSLQPENLPSGDGGGSSTTGGIVTTDRSTTGAGTGTRTTVTKTGIAGADAITQMVRNNGIWIQNLVKDVTASSEQEQQELLRTALEIQNAGSANAEAERAKSSIEAASAGTRERILKILGLDTREANNRISNELATFETLDVARQPLQKEIDERMSVGFFDNPIQYLINHTILPGKVEAYNALARRQNESIEKVETFQNIAAKQEQIDVSATADQIAVYHGALANADVAAANAKAGEARAAAAGTVARAATTVANMAGRQIDDEIKVAQWSKIVTSTKDEDSKKAKDKEDEEQLDSDLRRMGTLVGSPNMSLQALKRMGKQDQTEWLNRVAKNSIGDNLYEAVTFVSKYGNLNNMAQSGSAELSKLFGNLQKQIVDSATLTAAKIQQTGGKIPPRKELLESAANDIELEIFATRNNMLAARPTNPYLVNHKIMATAWTGDPANPVAKMVRDFGSQNVTIGDAQLFDAVRMQVRNGVMEPKVAAQALSDYYSEAIARNNKARSFQLFGLAPQEDYTILPRGARMRMNIVNPIEVENYFTGGIVRGKSASAMFPFVDPDVRFPASANK